MDGYFDWKGLYSEYCKKKESGSSKDQLVNWLNQKVQTIYGSGELGVFTGKTLLERMESMEDAQKD